MTKMNVENIRRTADAIENHELAKQGIGFNMAVFCSSGDVLDDHTSEHCGTVACIAGTAAALGGLNIRKASAGQIESAATEFLGLHGFVASELFVPGFSSMSNITVPKAVAVLRHLADTGEVDWSIIEHVE